MICAVVLAAGRSRRMGTQKLLLPVGGQPAIARVVDELLRARIDDVVVVIGADREPIAEALAGRRVRFATNTDPEGEMLGSVRCGLSALPEACEEVLVVLGDHPGITAELIGRLVAAFRDGGRGIAVPTCGGRRGHPLLCSTRYRHEVMSRYDGVGLRGLLDAHPADVLEVPIAAPFVLDDMDTPEDYRRIAARFRESAEPPAPQSGPQSNTGGPT
jgi:molybdenum cofactor cytidylyltransferase